MYSPYASFFFCEMLCVGGRTTSYTGADRSPDAEGVRFRFLCTSSPDIIPHVYTIPMIASSTMTAPAIPTVLKASGNVHSLLVLLLENTAERELFCYIIITELC